MWWRDGVIYHVYPRSFADSNADGVGDLPGITRRLDHLAWLGVDAVWLSPIHPSPDTDWGYDVADYLGVHPDLGTMDDFERLLGRARRLGIRVLLDLVPNHTSDRHPWFLQARSSGEEARRDWYVWADPAPDGGPPNNWVSNFMGPAWTLDPSSGQYYLHHFLATQPDLNWWNQEVREAFDHIQRFWYERGVDGFRIDVCHMIVKDRELRDNPPATDDDHVSVRLLGQRQVFNSNRPELPEVLGRWRRIADSFDPPRMLMGETYFFELEKLAAYYGDEGLHLAFNFPFLFCDFEAEPMARIVDTIESVLPGGAWPLWAGSNHDGGRFPTRWASGDERKIHCALMMLLTLRGTPVLYYGDEIGMPDVEMPPERFRDPVGIRFHPAHPGRDRARTPMQWSAGEGGFSAPGVEPWLPSGDATACNVETQSLDPGSVLNLCRDLIALRRNSADLRRGRYERFPASPGVWAYRRGEGTIVALNLSEAPGWVERVSGVVRVATQREGDGARLGGRLELEAWTGAVVEEA